MKIFPNSAIFEPVHQPWKTILLVALLVPCWVIAARYDIDLVNLHAVAQFLFTDITRVYAQNGDLGRWFYGPFSLVVIKPLGAFSYVQVKWFWIVLQTVAYVAFWINLTRLYPFLKSATWAWLVVWVASINPVHNNYQSNNIQLMLAAILVYAEWLAHSDSKRKLFWSGALVSIAASIKMFPLFIAAYYFLVKRNSVKVGVVVGMVAAQLLPFLVFGIDDTLFLYKDFIRNLTTYGEQNRTPDILCLPTMIDRWLPSAASWLNKVLVLGISALFMGWAFLKRKEAEPSIHWYALASALMVFLNPSTRPHYFIFYVPAFASLMMVRNRSLKWATTLAWILIAFTAEGVVGHHYNEILEWNNIPTLGMVLLCGTLAYGLIRYFNGVGDGGVAGGA